MAIDACACTFCCSSSRSTLTPSIAGKGDCREEGASSLDPWSSFWPCPFSGSCIVGLSSVSVSWSGVGEGGKAIKAGVVGLVFEVSEADAETCRLEGFLVNVLESGATARFGPRSRREDGIVTTGFLAGAVETADCWREGPVSALEVGLLRTTTGFSFAGADGGGGGGGIGTRRGPEDTKLCGPEVVGSTPEVIGRRRGAANIVARDTTIAWERTGPLTS